MMTTKSINIEVVEATAKRLFERWKADLADRDRSIGAVSENFNRIFEEFRTNAVTAEIAYEYLDVIVEKHFPNNHVVKLSYKRNKFGHDSMDEYHESWKNSIRDKGTNMFYLSYPPELEEPENKIPLPQGMSLEEYSKQRKHANSFPILDLNLLPELEELPDEEEVLETEENIDFSSKDLEN